MSELKNIIFDFGGVLLDLDYHETERQLTKVMRRDLNFKSLSEEEKDVFYNYEKGELSDELFLWQLQHWSVGVPTPRDLIDAWNGMLLDIKKEKLDFVLELSHKYKVYLLSNTNSLHIKFVMRLLKEKYEINDFDTRYFEKAYYSHLVGMRKPDKEIFDFIALDANIKKEESVFIDDLEENVKGAQLAGMPSMHFPANENLASWFNDNGLM